MATNTHLECKLSTHRSKHIHVYSNILSEAECAAMRRVIDSKRPSLEQKIQLISRERAIPAAYLIAINQVAAEHKLTAIPTFTVSRHSQGQEIGWHYDKVTGNSTHKLLIYLSDAVGTEFEDLPGVNTGPHNAGDGVIFDLKLKHRGLSIPTGERKYLIGVRLVTQKEE
jgi:hypothetical protein